MTYSFDYRELQLGPMTVSNDSDEHQRVTVKLRGDVRFCGILKPWEQYQLSWLALDVEDFAGVEVTAEPCPPPQSKHMLMYGRL